MKNIKTLLRYLKQNILHFRKMYLAMNRKINPAAHDLSIMIKHIHSIEKGLAMNDIRPGFGIPRINQMLDCLEEYLKIGGTADRVECSMAYSVIEVYISYHDGIGFSSEEYESVKQRSGDIFAPYIKELRNDVGGVLEIDTKENKVDLEIFEHCVMTRHSIRDFSGEPVAEELLRKAISIAMHAPSACNRQATRVYVLDRSKFDTIEGWTGGVKSFLDSVDKILIITGKMSAYEKDEFWQYSVSASIFAGYLTLALHAVGLGGCLLQRSLIEENSWKKVAKKHNIPKDEQVVCALAVGVPCDRVRVPMSQRLDYENVVKYL